jgi:hypothetical protein
MIACFSQYSSQVVARNLAVVLVRLAVALLPLVELAPPGAEPPDESGHGDLGLLRPLR